jgi:hypothetical protein
VVRGPPEDIRQCNWAFSYHEANMQQIGSCFYTKLDNFWQHTKQSDILNVDPDVVSRDDITFKISLFTVLISSLCLTQLSTPTDPLLVPNATSRIHFAARVCNHFHLAAAAAAAAAAHSCSRPDAQAGQAGEWDGAIHKQRFLNILFKHKVSV